MSYDGAIYTLLSADATLVAILTGGIYHKRDMTTEGIDRDGTPDAFDTIGLLKPCLVVSGRGNIPTNQLADPATQYTTTSQVVELWFYADRDAGLDTLESATERVYALLQGKKVTGAARMSLVNELMGRAPELDNAVFIRHDYQVIGRRVVV